MRKWILLIALLLMIGAPLMSLQRAEAGGQWFAYVYEAETKTIMRVYLDGTVEPYDLGVAADAYVSSWDMAFDRLNPAKVAFCVTNYSTGESIPPLTLYIRDLQQATTLAQRDLGKGIGCHVSAFSEDSTLIAVSIANYYPGDPEADTSKPTWQLFLLDANTGDIRYEINATSPLIAETSLTPDFTLLPEVRYFANGQALFIAVPYGIGGAPNFDAFNWRFEENTIAPVDYWGRSSIAVFGGELMWADQDPSLPFGEPGGPMPANNVLMLADKSGGTKMIYHSPDWLLSDIEYIHDGKQVAIMLYPSFDPNAQAAGEGKWIALDRSGAVTDLETGIAGYAEVVAAAQGYAIMKTDASTNTFSLIYHNLDTGETKELWNSGGVGNYWEIAWSVPVYNTGEALLPWTAWTP